MALARSLRRSPPRRAPSPFANSCSLSFTSCSVTRPLKRPLAPAVAASAVQTFRQHPTWTLVDYPGHTATVMDETWRWAAKPEVGRRVVF